MKIEEFEAELTARNALRRESQLPLLDIEQELERHRREEVERAYSNFFGAQLRPHVKHLKAVKPTGCSQGQGLYVAYLKIRERLKPELDQQWTTMLHTGSWKEWTEV